MAESCENIPETALLESRLSNFEQKEKDFLEFVAEVQPIDNITEEPDRPLSGLQCLLALTEILDKAAKLRKLNFDLEQRIEVLDQLKLLAEVQHSLQNATVDINSNGPFKSKRYNKTGSQSMDETKQTLYRVNSAESLDTFDSASKLESSEDFKLRGIKSSSKLSETWGKVKEKLSSKDVPVNKLAKRHKSSDFVSTVPNTLSTLDSSSSLTSAASSSGQFSQREVVITAASKLDDFGGVWLGEDVGEVTISLAGNNSPAATSSTYVEDYGGVYLGPPESSKEKRKESPIDNNNKEKARRKSSEPPKSMREPVAPYRPIRSSLDTVAQQKKDESRQSLPNKVMNILATSSLVPGGRKRNVYERPDGLTDAVPDLESPESSQTKQQSVPIVRKKSSRSLAQSLKIPGSSESKKKKSDSGQQLSKEFYKKMEEWNQIKDKQEKQEKSNKDNKGNKSKTQRFKNKKRTELKQRSKSAERSDITKRSSDDFEAKLREWSVRQGYHPSYYSDIRASLGSSDSLTEKIEKEVNGESRQSLHVAISKAGSEGLIRSTVGLSSGDSASSLPSNSKYLTGQNLKTLHEISQSADMLFHSPEKPKPDRKISRSEEAVYVTRNSRAQRYHNIPRLTHGSYDGSGVDVYAKASEESLEKHLSLYHITSDNDIQGSAAALSPAEETSSADVFLSPHKISVQNRFFTGRSVSETCEVSRSNEFFFDDANDTTICNSKNLAEDPVIDDEVSEESDDESLAEDSDLETDDRAVSANRKILESSRQDATKEPNHRKLSRMSRDQNSEEEIEVLKLLDESIQTDAEEVNENDPILPAGVKIQKDDKTAPQMTPESPPPAPSHRPVFNLSKIKKTSIDVIFKAPLISKITSEINPDTEVEILIDDQQTKLNRESKIETVKEIVDDKPVTGKPPLSPRNSNKSRPSSFQPTSPSNSSLSEDKSLDSSSTSSYVDINSNVQLYSSLTDDEKQSQRSEKITPTDNPDAPASPVADHIYLGTNVPLKTRLKCLAMEYQMEDIKREQQIESVSQQDVSGNSTAYMHKRTRSHDFLPSVNNTIVSRNSPSRYIPGQYGRSRPSSLVIEPDNDSKISKGLHHFESNSHDIYSMHGSPNLTRAHRSSIHRLKSADELIYEQQNANRQHLTKTPVSMRHSSDSRHFVSRREQQEIPREGLVQKVRSIFNEASHFNSNLGIDYTRPRSQQLS